METYDTFYGKQKEKAIFEMANRAYNFLKGIYNKVELVMHDNIYHSFDIILTMKGDYAFRFIFERDTIYIRRGIPHNFIDHLKYVTSTIRLISDNPIEIEHYSSNYFSLDLYSLSIEDINRIQFSMEDYKAFEEGKKFGL